MAHSHIWSDIGNLLLPLKHHAVYAQAIDWAIFWRFSNADREMVCRDIFTFSQLPESTDTPGIPPFSNTSVRGALRTSAPYPVFGRYYRYPLFHGYIQTRVASLSLGRPVTNLLSHFIEGLAPWP